MQVWHTLCNNSKPVSLVVNNRVIVLGAGREISSFFIVSSKDWRLMGALGVKCMRLTANEIREVRAANGEHAVSVTRCVLWDCILR